MNKPQPLTELEEALAHILAHVKPLNQTESVSTLEADGRVLAEDVVSSLNVPAFDNSQMDGYAVRLVDCEELGACSQAAAPAPSLILPISQRIAAGQVPQPLAPHSAARVFTGAPLPEGADAVVKQEDATLIPPNATTAQTTVHIRRRPTAGEWIRRAGEDVQQGTVVLSRGTRLSPAMLGLAASIGCAQLQVYARPRVALFSTGNELVMPDDVPPQALPMGAIYNSNRFFLRALLQRMGCIVSDGGIIADTLQASRQALADAASGHDWVITSGGVSVGEEDHIKTAVTVLGGLSLWQIGMKPGKPFAFGRVAQSYFCGLPGNPVASFVTFLLLVRPLLLKHQGAHDGSYPVTRLIADFDGPAPDSRRAFLRARKNAEGRLVLFPNQNSSVLTSITGSDGLVDTPAGLRIQRGDPVNFIAFSDLLAF